MNGKKLNRAQIREIVRLCDEAPKNGKGGTLTNDEKRKIAKVMGVVFSTVSKHWLRHVKRYKSPRVHKETRPKRATTQAEHAQQAARQHVYHKRRGRPVCGLCGKSMLDSLHCKLTPEFAQPYVGETSRMYHARTTKNLSDWFDRKKNPQNAPWRPRKAHPSEPIADDPHRLILGEPPSTVADVPAPSRGSYVPQALALADVAVTNGVVNAVRAALTLFDDNRLRDIQAKVQKAFDDGGTIVLDASEAWICSLALRAARERV